MDESNDSQQISFTEPYLENAVVTALDYQRHPTLWAPRHYVPFRWRIASFKYNSLGRSSIPDSVPDLTRICDCSARAGFANPTDTCW